MPPLRNVGPSSAGPGPNAVRPYVACAGAMPALPPRAQQKPFTQEQISNMVRDGFGDESGAKRYSTAGSEEVRALQRSSAALQMEIPITAGWRRPVFQGLRLFSTAPKGRLAQSAALRLTDKNAIGRRLQLFPRIDEGRTDALEIAGIPGN